MFARLHTHQGPLALLGLAGLLVALCAACGSDAGNADVAVANAGLPQAEPPVLVDSPVSRYAILVQDLGTSNFVADLKFTWDLTADIYAQTDAFASKAAGLAQLSAWGYREGFETAIVPEGGADALLSGSYIVHQELHLFETANGAGEAFAYFTGKIRSNGVSKPAEFATLGDESFGTRTISGRVGVSSSTDQVLHQVIFRRANVVAVVLTIGAAPLMDIEIARELGLIVDQKILDMREHPQPTPVPVRTSDGSGQARR